MVYDSAVQTLEYLNWLDYLSYFQGIAQLKSRSVNYDGIKD